MDNYTNTPLIILITGASGTGKTVIAKALEQYMPSQTTSVYYFDDIGIPNVETMIQEYGAPEKWQKWAIGAWIKRISTISNKELIFLEGSFYPNFALRELEELGIKSYRIICLSTERSIREKRLIEERKSPELVSQDMENYAKVLEAKTLECGGVVIDSSNKTTSKLITEMLQLVK